MEQHKPKQDGNWKLFLVLAVCAGPMIASYLTYYVIKPEGRTNYGAIIDPRNYPIPALGAATLDGKPAALADYKGKWLMLQVDSGACPKYCQKKLFEMRQLRLMQGKEMDRIERIWLINDRESPTAPLLRDYDGIRVLRADPKALQAWLPTEQGSSPEDHLYMIDPLGNLMMRFPKDADPNKVKKDIAKLLKASRIG